MLKLNNSAFISLAPEGCGARVYWLINRSSIVPPLGFKVNFWATLTPTSIPPVPLPFQSELVSCGGGTHGRQLLQDWPGYAFSLSAAWPPWRSSGGFRGETSGCFLHHCFYGSTRTSQRETIWHGYGRWMRIIPCVLVRDKSNFQANN